MHAPCRGSGGTPTQSEPCAASTAGSPVPGMPPSNRRSMTVSWAPREGSGLPSVRPGALHSRRRESRSWYCGGGPPSFVSAARR